MISRENRDTHRERVSQVTDERSLWPLAKWAWNRGNPRAAFTPDLKNKKGVLVSDVSEKMETLREPFFPKPANADLSDTQGYLYPPARGEWVLITEHEVRTAIKMVPLDKAPGKDQIPNRVLTVAQELLVPLLITVFNSSLNMQYCANAFKETHHRGTAEARESDYTLPKSFRPVALMTTRLRNGYPPAEYLVVLPTQLGGLPRR